MAVAWPAYLQEFLDSDSFDNEIGETVQRTEMDIGPAKVRRRFTHSIDKYSASIRVYQDTMTAFKTFFNTDLNGGVTEFFFEDPTTGQVETFRFIGTPRIRPVGSAGWYSVSFAWEKLS